MTMNTAPLPFLDLLDPAFDPAGPHVRAAREQHWCARTPVGLAVLRHAQLSALLSDRRLVQGTHHVLTSGTSSTTAATSATTPPSWSSTGMENRGAVERTRGACQQHTPWPTRYVGAARRRPNSDDRPSCNRRRGG
jgi:hypothetical protein